MSIWCAYTASLTLLVCPSFAFFFFFFFFFFFKSMKANFKASSKQNHLIHYRSEYRPLQNPLWDISVPTMKNSWGNIVTSLRNIEPKLVVKLHWYRKRYSQLCLCVSVSVTTKRATPLVKISKLVCLPKVNGVCWTYNMWNFLKLLCSKVMA